MQASEIDVEQYRFMQRGGGQQQHHMQQQQQQQQHQQAMPMFSVGDYCGRIQQEFQFLERQYATVKTELKMAQEHIHQCQAALGRTSEELQQRMDAQHKFVKILGSMMSQIPEQPRKIISEAMHGLQPFSPDDLIDWNQVENGQRAGSISAGPPTPVDMASSSSTSSSGKKQGRSNTAEFKPDVVEEDPNPITQRLISGSPPPLYPIGFDRSSRDEDSSEQEAKRQKKSGSSGKSIRKEHPSGPMSSSLSPVTGASSSPTGIPMDAKMVTTLPHNDVVCAVAFKDDTNQVFTGVKGCIKLWSLDNCSKPVAEMRCLNNSYIRSCRLAGQGSCLLVAGEASIISTWDLTGPGPRLRSNLPISSTACYALTSSDEDHTFYSCFSDGVIGGWDMRSDKQVKTLLGHTDGVSCIDLSPDGTKVVTGSLDSTLRVWDLGTAREIAAYTFPSQIFSVGICPGESWVAVGLSNSNVEVLNLLNSNCKYQLRLHESSVLSLKFANSGKWFLTTGKDKLLNSWRSPFGAGIFQCHEPNSILCCDISSDDRTIVTGSGNRCATIYEVQY